MARFHRLNFLFKLHGQLGLVSAVNQHLQSLFKKFVGHFLTLESHHAVLAGDASKLDHALDHYILLFHRRQKGFRHNAEATKEGW